MSENKSLTITTCIPWGDINHEKMTLERTEERNVCLIFILAFFSRIRKKGCDKGKVPIDC